ncbi:MAG: ribosome assembly RNA-binding protein YhbY [Roseburia sp.]|jgi:RNA-binding protein|nr:ribosome assembly RNA-binding protein YhbY [Eubacterium sp.]MBS6820097.1 ribosome assembly RNA-binding protein YhbY [Roseburia sp.]MCI5495913.1 ribosome assembly RNA-binding protein YhbY [Roseburia sp.]PWM03464.1 MAG: ribosome assembly RNA-binding protein YhbY [Clostridiales bacterium]
MTSKQRAYLKSLAMKITPILQIGKSSVTPELISAVDEALEARELIKMHILKNCFDDPKEIAQVIAERTRSEVVQVIGKKVVLYRESKDNKKIELPKPSKKA